MQLRIRRISANCDCRVGPVRTYTTPSGAATIQPEPVRVCQVSELWPIEGAHASMRVVHDARAGNGRDDNGNEHRSSRVISPKPQTAVVDSPCRTGQA